MTLARPGSLCFLPKVLEDSMNEVGIVPNRVPSDKP